MKKTILLFYCSFFSTSIFLWSQNFPQGANQLAHWYIADSVSMNGTNRIDTIYDLVNNNHLIQPTLANQASFVENEPLLNGESVIHFDGISNSYEANFSSATPSIFTVFTMWKTSSSGNMTFLDSKSGPILDNAGGSKVRMFLNSAVQYNKSSPFADYILTKAEFNGSNSKLYENNILKVQGDVGAKVLPGLFMGKFFSGGRYFNGDFSQLLIFNGLLDSLQTRVVESYLSGFYTPKIDLGEDFVKADLCDTTIHAGNRFTTYLWSDGSTNESFTISRPGIYWVEVTDRFGLRSRDSVHVTYSNLQYPSANAFCPNNVVLWSPGNNEQGYTYLWSDGSSADSLLINSTGDYYVSITDNIGCTKTSDTLHFTEDTFHSTLSLGADTSFCQGNTIALQAGASQAVSYLWNTGETTPDIQPQTTGEYSVTATNVNGCTAKDTLQVTIIGIAPVVGFSFPLMTCTADTVAYVDTSFTLDGATINSWEWDFGNGEMSYIPNDYFNYPTPGYYQIKLTVGTTNGCQKTLTKTVAVNVSPEVSFVSQFSCEQQNVNFSASQQTTQLMTNWSWNFGDPGSDTNNVSQGQNVTHPFSTYGDFNVTLVGTDINGCTDTAVVVKTIKPAPHPNFSFENICAESTAHFTNSSTMPAPFSIQGYIWDFGNGFGSQYENPQSNYNFPGNYNVKLTAMGSNGCKNDTTIAIQIYDLPNVQHGIQNDCALLNTLFLDSSTVNDGTISQVNWLINGENSLTGEAVNHIFGHPGLYEIKQEATSSFGCVTSSTFNVLIHEPLQASFTVTPQALIAGYPVNFESAGVGATQYTWTFGNYTTSHQQDTTLIFPDSLIDSTLTILLTTSNTYGCTDTVSAIYPVQGRNTDLALTKILYQDFDGYLKIGVRMKNNGTTPFTSIYLKVQKTGATTFKETWNGLLLGGDSTVYVFSALPLNTLPSEDTLNNYICIEGTVAQPSQFIESTLENNTLCESLSASEAIIVQPYPNPVGEQLTIKVIASHEVDGILQIIDANGRLVYSTRKQTFKSGFNKLEINTANWSNGSYRILWKGTEKLKPVSFVKE